MSNTRKDMARAYGIALSRLRKAHDEEFHAILSQVYIDLDMPVKKRMSRLQSQQKRVADARRLIAAVEL